MLDMIYKILGVANRVLWFVIGLIVLYAIVRAGTQGITNIVGAAATGQVTQSVPPATNGAPPNGAAQPGLNSPTGIKNQPPAQQPNVLQPAQ